MICRIYIAVAVGENVMYTSAACASRGIACILEMYRWVVVFRVAQGGAEARLWDVVPHMRIEVAVRALGEAERPVDIERQRFHRREI